MPESSSKLSLVQAADTVPHKRGRGLAAGRLRKMRGALVLAARFAVGGSMSYALDGVVGAVIGLIVIVLASVAVAVMLSAMLGHRDSHSPFTRMMLLIYAIAGRQPGDYLPAASQEDQQAAQ